jgi:hypothetical protein
MARRDAVRARRRRLGRQSARALEQAAELMRAQAELYERTIRTLRKPSQIAKSAAGLKGSAEDPR